MTNKVVGTGVGGELTTRGRPSQKEDLHCLDPKKGTHFDSLQNGKFLQSGHSGVALSGVRTSEVVTTADAVNDVAAQADSGVVGSIIGSIAVSGASSSDLQDINPLQSYPGRSANGAGPKVFLSHGESSLTSASSGKHEDRELKTDTQGLGTGGNGYDTRSEKGHYGQGEAHYNPDLLTAKTGIPVVVEVEVGKGYPYEQRLVPKSSRGTEVARGSGSSGNNGVR